MEPAVAANNSEETTTTATEDCDVRSDQIDKGAGGTDAVGHHRYPGMILIPGGTFRMGSDKHYPEEAPVHRVAVDSFFIDRTPVTNRQFKQFVSTTGYVTFAEIPPDPKAYPGALAHMLYAGSLVFTPPSHQVDLRNWGEWWTFLKGADWRHPYGAKEQYQPSRQSSGGACLICGCASLRALGGQGFADRSGGGVGGAR